MSIFVSPGKGISFRPGKRHRTSVRHSAEIKPRPFAAPDTRDEAALPRNLAAMLAPICSRYGLASSSLSAPALVIAGAAIGSSAVLETKFFPGPVNGALQCGLLDTKPPRLENAVQALCQALRDAQDLRLSAFAENRQEIETKIRDVQREREAFFRPSFIRDSKIESKYALQISRLREQLHPVLMAENRPPGSLLKAVGMSGGSGLLALYCDLELQVLLKAPKKSGLDFETMSSSWAGRTPESGYLSVAGATRVVRPVVGGLLVCTAPTAARLLCSEDPAIRYFSDQLIFVDGTDSAPRCDSGSLDLAGAEDHWHALLTRLVACRASGHQRQLTLSRAAVAELQRYETELYLLPPGQSRLAKQATLLAAKIGLILVLCSGDRATEISADTMRVAIHLTRCFVRETAAAASRCVAADRTDALNLEDGRLLEKIQDRGPLSQRNLQRACSRITVDDLQRVLNRLIHAGLARCRPDGLIEAVPQTGGAAR